MRIVSACFFAAGFCAFVIACGGTVAPPASNPDAAESPPDSGVFEPDTGPIIGDMDAGELPDSGEQAMVINGGNVSGAWCGAVDITASVVVPAGETLTICAGSNISLSAATPVRLSVDGTLRVEGAAGNVVRFGTSSTNWDGIKVSGTLEGGYFDIVKANIGIDGLRTAAINVNHVNITQSRLGLQSQNGGVFRYLTIIGGSTVTITGGILDIADSTIDLLGMRGGGPDCTDWAGGGATIDHVRFTGCHCPIHINRATLPINVTNSIFDNGAVPVMIAQCAATFRHNHFLSTGAEFLDIGSGITADVGGNYWSGHAPRITTGNAGQFTGTGDYSTTPFDDVGPRPE